MTAARRRKRTPVVPQESSAEVSRRLLLDTHAWLWWQADDPRLGVATRRMLQHASEVRFSAASAWEIGIKLTLGKLSLPRDADISAALADSGFLPLAVDIAHAQGVQRLPPLHRDPFDRMLVAQARIEGLTLVTADRQLGAYGIPVMDATL